MHYTNPSINMKERKNRNQSRPAMALPRDRLAPRELRAAVHALLGPRELAAARACDRASRAELPRALAALRRAHAALRLRPAVRALREGALDAAEARDLRAIRAALAPAAPAALAERMAAAGDAPTLRAFNDAVGWLREDDDFATDDDLVDLLMTPSLTADWPPALRRYAEHWRREFVETWCLGWRTEPLRRLPPLRRRPPAPALSISIAQQQSQAPPRT